MNVRRVYKKIGFHISTLHADEQFDTSLIRGAAAELNVTLNPVSEDEHVPEAERYISTINERSRCMQTTLSFKKIPDRITMEIVSSCVFWMNRCPSKSRVSDTMVLRTIITGPINDYNNHCKLQCWGYVKTYESHDNISGTVRTIGALDLRPKGNEQGGNYFYSLRTVRTINRNRCTQLPMTDDVISRIHALVINDPMGITFTESN